LLHDHLDAGVIRFGDLPELSRGRVPSPMKTFSHSNFLSSAFSANFSVTFMVAMISLASGSKSAISSPSLMPSASSWLTSRVTGTGQKVPSAKRHLSHTLFQSALVMKPVRGLKPPIPIMIRSPLTRGEIDTFLRPSAFFFSSAS
jgi:hypothetical protein